MKRKARIALSAGAALLVILIVLGIQLYRESAGDRPTSSGKIRRSRDFSS